MWIGCTTPRAAANRDSASATCIVSDRWRQAQLDDALRLRRLRVADDQNRRIDAGAPQLLALVHADDAESGRARLDRGGAHGDGAVSVRVRFDDGVEPRRSGARRQRSARCAPAHRGRSRPTRGVPASGPAEDSWRQDTRRTPPAAQARNAPAFGGIAIWIAGAPPALRRYGTSAQVLGRRYVKRAPVMRSPSKTSPRPVRVISW